MCKILSWNRTKKINIQKYIVPDHTSNMVDTIEPSNLINQNYVDNIMNTIVTEAPLSKRRRSSTCSSSSSLSSCSSSSSSSEGEDEDETFSSLNSRRSSLSSESEEEQEEIITPYMHRRQMEEMILDKITNQLDPEKLPGILTIISKQQQEEEEEVEIDLARLDRDQLSRILSYVDACLKEKQGGPKVKLSNYTLKPKPVAAPSLQKDIVHPTPKKQQQTKNRSNRRNRRKSIVETGHIVRGSPHSQLSASHGPISMSALTELESTSNNSNKKPANKRKRKAKKRKSEDDMTVQMSNKSHSFKDSIASTKPKRKSAVHKRKLLEEMLQPSSDSDEDEVNADGGSGIIIFGNEQMDLAVTQNETIVHQERRLSIIQKPCSITCKAMESDHVSNSISEDDDDDDDDDELIDIMM